MVNFGRLSSEGRKMAVGFSLSLKPWRSVRGRCQRWALSRQDARRRVWLRALSVVDGSGWGSG